MHGTSPSGAVYLDYEVTSTSGVEQCTTSTTVHCNLCGIKCSPFRTMEKFEVMYCKGVVHICSRKKLLKVTLRHLIYSTS